MLDEWALFTDSVSAVRTVVDLQCDLVHDLYQKEGCMLAGLSLL